MHIYFDNAATAFLQKQEIKFFSANVPAIQGNPSSKHTLGVNAAIALERSRRIIARSLNADSSEIFFTSGGSEGNNWILKGLAFKHLQQKKHIIISAIEHSSVLEPALWLKKNFGVALSYAPVDKFGVVKPQQLRRLINKHTMLVSVMHANNEIGTIQPIAELADICHERNVFIHSDACQSYSKEKIDVQKMRIDFLTINAHKLYGPKGIGAVFVRQGTALEPLIHGGGQENDMRAGTQNVPGIVAFAQAVDFSHEQDYERVRKLRDSFIKALLKEFPGCRLNGHPQERLCNNINICIPDCTASKVFDNLNKRNIFISTGSACSAYKTSPSHVLRAIGLSAADSLSSLRITLGVESTPKEVETMISVLRQCIAKKG